MKIVNKTPFRRINASAGSSCDPLQNTANVINRNFLPVSGKNGGKQSNRLRAGFKAFSGRYNRM